MIRNACRRALCGLMILVSLIAATAHAGETRHLQVQNDKGAMDYDLYLPSGHDPAGAPVPLIVALHGGNESAQTTATVSGWNILAEEFGFLVAYPQEDPNNGELGIWRWSAVPRTGREDRAASLVALITADVIDNHPVDRTRVLITGMSAGAGMAVAVAITFPELYSVVGAEVGCAYGLVNCQHPPLCDLSGCETEGVENAYLSGEESAQAAYAQMGERAHRLPAIVSYGDLDGPAIGVNQDEHVAMWTALNDWIDDAAANHSVPRDEATAFSGSEGGANYDLLFFNDAGGCVVVERWIIAGLDHSYSGARDGEGNTGYGPDMRRHQYEFLIGQTSDQPGCPASIADTDDLRSGSGTTDTLGLMLILTAAGALRRRRAIIFGIFGDVAPGKAWREAEELNRKRKSP